MPSGVFVTYCRVSTARQGRSGLGLEAQRAAVKAYLREGEWRIAGEFVEVESGKNADRPELAKALTMARLHRAALVVAKVDRLTRSLAFLCVFRRSRPGIPISSRPPIRREAGHRSDLKPATAAAFPQVREEGRVGGVSDQAG